MRRVANILVGTGVLVWVLGVVAWVLGVWVTLPPDTVRVLVLALSALTGGVLLTAGGVVARAARRAGAAADAAASTEPTGRAVMGRRG